MCSFSKTVMKTRPQLYLCSFPSWDWLEKTRALREGGSHKKEESWSMIGPPCTEGDLKKRLNIGLTVEKTKPLLFGGIKHFGFVCNAISLPYITQVENRKLKSSFDVCSLHWGEGLGLWILGRLPCIIRYSINICWKELVQLSRFFFSWFSDPEDDSPRAHILLRPVSKNDWGCSIFKNSFQLHLAIPVSKELLHKWIHLSVFLFWIIFFCCNLKDTFI